MDHDLAGMTIHIEFNDEGFVITSVPKDNAALVEALDFVLFAVKTALDKNQLLQ